MSGWVVCTFPSGLPLNDYVLYISSGSIVISEAYVVGPGIGGLRYFDAVRGRHHGGAGFGLVVLFGVLV